MVSAPPNRTQTSPEVQSALKNLARTLGCTTNPAVHALLPKGYQGVATSTTPDARLSWEGKPSFRTYACYAYYGEDGEPFTMEDEGVMTTDLSINPATFVITGSGSDKYGSYTIRGEKRGVRAFFVKSYSGWAFRYEGILTPWGLVGEWAQAPTPGDALGSFYMWVA